MTNFTRAVLAVAISVLFALFVLCVFLIQKNGGSVMKRAFSMPLRRLWPRLLFCT
jgi:hypothetical protein